MKHRPLGRTDLSVSELGFGCASWWGMRAFDETEALGLVHQALDAGVTLFDTGASYSRGEAEPRLGRALKGRDTSRLQIATKAGTRFEGGHIRRDFSAPAIRASVEASLGRLGLDRLDILQLHGPGLEDLTDPLRAELAQLRQRGLIRAWGINSFDTPVLEAAMGLEDLDVLMLDFNVLRPNRIDLITRARAAGKGVLAGMPLAMGHMAGQVTRIRGLRDLWYAARALRHHRRDVALGARYGFMGAIEGMSAHQAALAFVLGTDGVSAAVMGTTRPSHLAQNLTACDLILPEAVRTQILTTGLAEHQTP
jgi:aryl-alcohol dehydrogenase-like predicted oxidoreductase